MQMDLLSYIGENFKILIPTIYVIGMILKNTSLVKDNYIPIILLTVSILLSIAVDRNVNIDGVIQGVLVTGVCVLGNQIYIQLFKKM